jgi:hypothetical protein
MLIEGRTERGMKTSNTLSPGGGESEISTPNELNEPDHDALWSCQRSAFLSQSQTTPLQTSNQRL